MNMQTKLTKMYDADQITWEEYNEKMKKVMTRQNRVINKRKERISNIGRTTSNRADRDRLFGKP